MGTEGPDHDKASIDSIGVGVRHACFEHSVLGLGLCDSSCGSWAPDGASVLATSRGVTPVTWTAPAMRSSEEIGAALQSLGYPQDDGGAIELPGAALGSIQLAFDPNLKNPLMGARTDLYVSYPSLHDGEPESGRVRRGHAAMRRKHPLAWGRCRSRLLPRSVSREIF
jgi:hypothetical protein